MSEESPTEAAVRARLRTVVDPCSAANGTPLNLEQMGLIDSIAREQNEVTVHLRLTSPMCMMIPYFIEQIDRAVGPLPGVRRVHVETDAGLSWHPDDMSQKARQKLSGRRRMLTKDR